MEKTKTLDDLNILEVRSFRYMFFWDPFPGSRTTHTMGILEDLGMEGLQPSTSARDIDMLHGENACIGSQRG